MNRFKLVWPWVSLLTSILLIGWTHFDKVQREQARQQRQLTLDSINRDGAQLQSESGAYHCKAKALIAKKHLEGRRCQLCQTLRGKRARLRRALWRDCAALSRVQRGQLTSINAPLAALFRQIENDDTARTFESDGGDDFRGRFRRARRRGCIATRVCACIRICARRAGIAKRAN